METEFQVLKQWVGRILRSVLEGQGFPDENLSSLQLSKFNSKYISDTILALINETKLSKEEERIKEIPSPLKGLFNKVDHYNNNSIEKQKSIPIAQFPLVILPQFSIQSLRYFTDDHLQTLSPLIPKLRPPKPSADSSPTRNTPKSTDPLSASASDKLPICWRQISSVSEASENY